MIRVVLDTNILVAAFRSRDGASNLLLRYVAGGKLMPLISVALFLEYEAVLKRAEEQLVHRLSIPDVDNVLAAFASASEVVDVSFLWRPQLKDPKDEMVLQTAVNGRAEFLVTHNVKDFRAAADKFSINLITPGDLVRKLKD